MENKPRQSYTEVVDYNGEKLDITINNYSKPIRQIEDKLFYTYIRIEKHGHLWGEVFYEGPIAESDFEAEIKNTKQNLHLFKKNYEFNKEQFSKN